MNFELGWKLLKDVLEIDGHTDVASPSKAIRQAYQNRLIPNGQTWVKALNGRNSSVHAYDEEEALILASEIKSIYLPVLIRLKDDLNNRISH